METLPVYCISGLGADERVFENLSLPGCSVYPLPWLAPVKNEPIGDYAQRMASSVRHPNPVLMGLSFGGIMAIELARHIKTRRLWLLSTVKRRCELPGYMRFGNHLPLHRVVLRLNPHRWLGPLENYNLSVETKEEATMVADFRRSVSPDYIRWAINAIITWSADEVPSNAYHIHGGRDRIFPVHLARPDVVIADAGHFMVHNRAEAVSALLCGDALALS